ncbi:MAG: PorT family protein [Bacteroidaceae bacterium]|nr:PorT family protein [Bacteroidaceae bacterium]
MRRLFLACLMSVCIAAPLAAQHLVFHTGGGLATRHGASDRMIGTFKAGLSLELEFSQTLTFEPGLLYFAKGWKDKDKTVYIYDDQGNIVLDDAGNERTGVMNVTTNANYLVLPLLLNYYIPLQTPHYIMFTAGPYLAYGIGGKRKTRGDTSLQGSARFFYSQNTFSQEDMHRIDAGLTLGAGYEFSRMINAGIEVDWGLLNVSKGHHAKNVSMLFTLGYRIPF